MEKKWSYRKIGSNLLEFSRENESLYFPQTIGGRYLIDGILSAEGGFGIIFTAKDTRLFNRRVLVKARRYDREAGLWSFQYDSTRNERIEGIREQIMFEYDCLVNFRRYQEARIPNLNDIVHDFSPSLHGPHKDKDGTDYNYEDSCVNKEPYLILQNIEGENLYDYLQTHFKEKYWEKFVLELSREICTIFENFHFSKDLGDTGEEYFIYQDLKPSNIMVSHETFMTLIDLGAITFHNEDGKTELDNHGTGTWGYMPPEMNPDNRMLNHLDYRVDIFTLGATMFHLLTNEDPTTYPEQYPEFDIDKLRDMNHYGEETIKIVEKATQPDRNERHKDIKEMRSKIHNALMQLSKG